MYLQRRMVSYIAMFIATLYYFFGRAEALAPELPTVVGQTCHPAAEKTQMIQCKAEETPRRVGRVGVGP